MARFAVPVVVVVTLAGAGAAVWTRWGAEEAGVVVRTLTAPAPVAAVRAASDGVLVELRDGRRVGLTLVAGRPVLGPAPEPAAPEPVAPAARAGWDDILRLAAHNDARFDPVAVCDVDGDRTDDWVALETERTAARLLVLHRTRTGPVTVAFLDDVAGRSDDGALPVALVDTEGTGRPDILVATADRRVLLRVRLWPGRLEVEERIALPAPLATAIVPLSPVAVAVGLGGGTIATVAWPAR